MLFTLLYDYQAKFILSKFGMILRLSIILYKGMRFL